MSYKTDELRFKIYAKHGDMCCLGEHHDSLGCASRHKAEDFVLVASFAYLTEAIDYAQRVSTGERGVTVRLRTLNYGDNKGYSVSEYSPSGVRLGLPDATPQPRKVKAASEDKRLAADKARASEAIAICDRALVNPFFANITAAIADERARLEAALVDARLLWMIYRKAERNGKAPYFVADVVAESVAA